MPISLKDVMKNLNLTEEQASKLGEVQSTFETAYNNDLEESKKGIQTKNQELLDKLAEARKKAMPDDFDSDAYKEYKENKEKIAEEKRKLKEQELIDKKNWDKLRNDLTNTHEQTLKKVSKDKDTVISTLRRSLDNELIENAALKEIKKAEGNHVLLMPHIKQHITTFQDEQTGKFKTKVVDEYGKDRMNAETGAAMTVEELVTELKADKNYAGAFPVQNHGSDTTVTNYGNNYNSTNNPFDKSSKNYSLTEQAKLNKANPTLAKSLREAAKD